MLSILTSFSDFVELMKEKKRIGILLFFETNFFFMSCIIKIIAKMSGTESVVLLELFVITTGVRFEMRRSFVLIELGEIGIYEENPMGSFEPRKRSLYLRHDFVHWDCRTQRRTTEERIQLDREHLAVCSHNGQTMD